MLLKVIMINVGGIALCLVHKLAKWLSGGRPTLYVWITRVSQIDRLGGFVIRLIAELCKDPVTWDRLREGSYDDLREIADSPEGESLPYEQEVARLKKD